MKNYDDWYFLNADTRVVLSRGQLSEGQTPEQRYAEMAYHAQKILKIDGYADRMISYMKKGWASFSTPVMNNFGKETGLPISCFGSYIGDSISSIFEKNAEIAHMTQKGGGTSFYLGGLRPRGSKIKGGGVSEGPIRFAEIFDKTVEIVNQGGVRRGACAAYLPADYENPQDVLDFLELREDQSPVQTLFLGLTFTDKWLEELKEDIAEKRQTDKTKIWRRMLKKRDAKGHPYLMFKDNANNQKPQVYKDKAMEIVASNLCVAPDTKILTDKGYVEIVSVAGTEQIVWNGEEWSKSFVSKTGEDKTLFRVSLSDGSFIDCTDYHDWYTIPSYGKAPQKVKTDNLCIGDKLIKFDLPKIEGEKKLNKAYTNGFFTGDGCRYNGKNIMYLYGDKQNLIEFLEVDTEWKRSDSSDRLMAYANDLEEKFFVPSSDYTVKSRLDWLSGLFDADGTVAYVDDCNMIQLGSINLDFLRETKLMLQTLGIRSHISKMHDAANRLLPANDGTGELKYFYCQDAYRLLISSVQTSKLIDLGLSCNRLKLTSKSHQREAARFVTVSSIIELEGLHDTYCFNEPKRHMGVFNGVLTGNCNEIMLPSSEDESFVCCLSSVNLLHYDSWKDTRFVQDMHLFLDAVMTEFIEKSAEIPEIKAAHNFAKRHRALGLGVLGYHSYLKAKGVPVESEEARSANIGIFSHIKSECDKANEWSARKYGEPDLLKGYGKRNTTSMAIAPTLSSSFILGQVSAGCELDDSVYYSKNNQRGEFTWKCPSFVSILNKYEKNNETVWDSIARNSGSVQQLEFLSDLERAVFKTFGEIDQAEVIVQAADRQKSIDQGQSLNLKYTSETKLKTKSDHMFLAHELGLKGLYYQINENAVHKLLSKEQECESCSA